MTKAFTAVRNMFADMHYSAKLDNMVGYKMLCTGFATCLGIHVYATYFR
jgi:hypothetical protein